MEPEGKAVTKAVNLVYGLEFNALSPKSRILYPSSYGGNVDARIICNIFPVVLV